MGLRAAELLNRAMVDISNAAVFFLLSMNSDAYRRKMVRSQTDIVLVLVLKIIIVVPNEK